MVGDPSGKDESRPLRTVEEIEANKASIRDVFAQGAEFRRRQDRRDHGRQCRLAAEARLYRDAARRRPAFLGQPHADHGFGASAARARAGDELHRVQLHGLPVLRLRRAGAPLRLQPADGRLGPVGQHRQRRRSRPAHGHASALRADDAAADHRFRRQDGQDRAGRGLAQRRPVQPLRFLAVLAQHRGCRRRPFPEAVHDAADGGDRAARKPGRLGDQRSQEDPGHRGDDAAAWPRGCRRGGRNGAQDFRGRRARRDPADGRGGEGRAGSRHRPAVAAASRPALRPRMARRGGTSRAVRCASTTFPSRTSAASSASSDLGPQGLVKLSLGRKKHVACVGQSEPPLPVTRY